MQVKDAVRVAKEYLAELFSDEGAHGFAVQEVEFLEHPDRWSITPSFPAKGAGGRRNAVHQLP